MNLSIPMSSLFYFRCLFFIFFFRSINVLPHPRERRHTQNTQIKHGKIICCHNTTWPEVNSLHLVLSVWAVKKSPFGSSPPLFTEPLPKTTGSLREGSKQPTTAGWHPSSVDVYFSIKSHIEKEYNFCHICKGRYLV